MTYTTTENRKRAPRGNSTQGFTRLVKTDIVVFAQKTVRAIKYFIQRLFRSTRAFYRTTLGAMPVTTTGFTLIETFVAITIFTIAIVGPLTLAASSLSNTGYAQDQMTAYFLAQEGLEAVRSVRDYYLIYNGTGAQVGFYRLLDGQGCTTASGCTIDATASPLTSFAACSSNCSLLQIKASGLYGYESGGQASRFTRTIYAQNITDPNSSNESDEVLITSRVDWTGKFGPRHITVTDDLFNVGN